jgi:hypothetical protein
MWFRNRVEAKVGVGQWPRCDNDVRPDSSLGYLTPLECRSRLRRLALIRLLVARFTHGQTRPAQTDDLRPAELSARGGTAGKTMRSSSPSRSIDRSVCVRTFGDTSRLRSMRLHDLRHSACTRMLEAGVPFAVVVDILGWSPARTTKMDKLYGHIGDAARRKVVEAIGAVEFEQGYSPVRRAPSLRMWRMAMRHLLERSSIASRDSNARSRTMGFGITYPSGALWTMKCLARAARHCAFYRLATDGPIKSRSTHEPQRSVTFRCRCYRSKKSAKGLPTLVLLLLDFLYPELHRS